MTRFLSLSFTLAVLLSACTAPERIPGRASPTPLDPREVKINNLLDQARTAFEDNRLTTPDDDNAYLRYLQVLALDPLREEAAMGINAIVEQYLSWAIEGARRGNFKGAERFVRKAETIDGTHPNILPVRTMIKDKELEETTTFDLDPMAVANRLADQIAFASIAEQIVADPAFVTIRAASDEIGRWIYQELNRLSTVRIEARFEASHSPSISLTR